MNTVRKKGSDSLETKLAALEHSLFQDGTELWLSKKARHCLLAGPVESADSLCTAADTLLNRGIGVSVMLGATESEEVRNAIAAHAPACMMELQCVHGGQETGSRKGIGLEVQFAAGAVLEIVFHGIIAHGSRPDLGINAVDAAALAITTIRSLPMPCDFRHAVQLLYLDAGGSSINMIPDRVVMRLRCTAETSEGLSILLGRVRNALECAALSIDVKTDCSVLRRWQSAGGGNQAGQAAVRTAAEKNHVQVHSPVYCTAPSILGKIAAQVACPYVPFVMYGEDAAAPGRILADAVIELMGNEVEP